MNEYQNMIGRTMVEVTGREGDEEMVFEAEDGSVFKFYHSQDCCESVSICTIDGDLSDLVGSPILMAEAVSSEGAEAPSCLYDSYTWTFIKFATVKGYVTVRWLGVSNGWYSEMPYYKEIIRGE